MRWFWCGLLFCITAFVQAYPRYYVFGAAEDDCVIKHEKNGRIVIEGEACLCIQVDPRKDRPIWKLNWKNLSCSFSADKPSGGPNNCEQGGCTEHQCLEELYDTQHGGNEVVGESTCLANRLPLLPA